MYKYFIIGLISFFGLGIEFWNAFLLEDYVPARSDDIYIEKITARIDNIIGKNKDATDTLITKLSEFMYNSSAVNNLDGQRKQYIIHKITDHVLIKQKTSEDKQASEKASLAAEAQNFQLAYELTKDIPLTANLDESNWAAIIQFAIMAEGGENFDTIKNKYQSVYEKFKNWNLINFIFWLQNSEYEIDINEFYENAQKSKSLKDYLPYLYVYIAKNHYDFFHWAEAMNSDQYAWIFKDEKILNILIELEYIAEDETDYITLKDLGTFYQRLGFFEKAQGAFEKAAAHYPTYATYQSLATSLLWTSCNEERSLELFSKAAVLFDGDVNHTYTHDITRWTESCGSQDARNEYMKKNKERRDFLDKAYYSLFDVE